MFISFHTLVLFSKENSKHCEVSFTLCLSPLQDNAINITQEANSAKDMHVQGSRKTNTKTAL